MKATLTDAPGKTPLASGRGDAPAREAAASLEPVPEFSIKKILVPIDFSDCCKKALRYAIPFARTYGASLTLIYVVPRQYAATEYGRFDPIALEEQIRAGASKELATLAGEEIPPEISVRTIVRSGPAVCEIVEAARLSGADLLIISTHGRTGLKHVLLGSVAENVVRRAPCPVLVVREREQDFVPN